MGTLHYREGADLSVPQNLGGLSRRRGPLTDKLVRGWRVLLRPVGDRPGMPLGEIAAGETLMPVGTITAGDSPNEFRYQPVLYAQANLQEYRARRRRSEQVGRFMLGAMAVALTISVGIVLFVQPGARRATTLGREAGNTPVAALSAPSVPSRPAFVRYEVKKGDTLGAIARRHHVKLRLLMQANGLDEKSTLQIGQVLRIPRLDAAPVLPAANPSSGIHPALPAAGLPGGAAPSLNGLKPDPGQKAWLAAGPFRPAPDAGSQRVANQTRSAGAQMPTRPTESVGSGPAGPKRPESGAAASENGKVARHTSPRVYKVREGDFPEIIAKRHGIKPATLLFANGLHERSILQPGQELKIPPADGYYHTVRRGETLGKLLERAGVDEATFRRLNPGVGSVLRARQTVFVPGKVPVVDPPRREKPANRSKRFRERDGRKRASRGFWGDLGRAVAGGFNWPISSRAISSGFGERGHDDWHPGLDIRAGIGTPIRAARDGVVVRSGWEGAYGRMVEIDHGGGVTTRYAHASKLLVREGERVRAGEVIGQVGTTGRSTGPHLHYEVRINGRAVNPRKVH